MINMTDKKTAVVAPPEQKRRCGYYRGGDRTDAGRNSQIHKLRSIKTAGFFDINQL